jgi:hypothetical protein
MKKALNFETKNILISLKPNKYLNLKKYICFKKFDSFVKISIDL